MLEQAALALGFCTRVVFPNQRFARRRPRQALLRALNPGQRTGLKRRSGVARRPRRRPPRAAHRGGKPPAHRALRHTEHSGTPRRRRGPEAHQGELEAKHQGSTERVCTTPYQHAPTGWCSVRIVRPARVAGAQLARRRAAPEERILCCSSPTLRDQRANFAISQTVSGLAFWVHFSRADDRIVRL